LVVEGDGGGEGEKAAGDAGAQAVQGACAVAFEGEDVFGCPEEAFDALADRREVRAAAGLVFAAGPQERDVQLGGAGLEVAAGRSPCRRSASGGRCG